MEEQNRRPAMAIMVEINEGRMMQQLAEAMREATAAVRQHGKAATVTLKMTFSPLKDGMKYVEAPVIITPEIATKLPKEQLEGSVFFPNEDNDLSRTPTRQGNLGLNVKPITTINGD